MIHAPLALSWAARARQESVEQRTEVEPPDFESGLLYFVGAGVLTLALVLAHLAAPRMRPWLDKHAETVGSFGGGLAVAYAFLHLIPELDEGHEILGAMVFLVPLLGFVAYYLPHRWRIAMHRSGTRWTRATCVVQLINLCVYNGLIIYGTPQIREEAGWAAAPLTAALLIHLLHLDYSFGAQFKQHFDAIGRYVLAAACVGALLLAMTARLSEPLNDILVAFLAGSVLFNVFREEIPDENHSRVRWFVGGIALFAVCAIPSMR